MNHDQSSIIASKPRTGLRTRPSEAKYLEEAYFDTKTGPAPPKSTENDEKPIRNRNFFRKKKFPNFFFFEKKIGVKKSKVANRPKRALPKFRADPSHVRRVRGRLGGIREA